MRKSNATRTIAGFGFIVVGLVLVSHPELINNKPIPTDRFEAIERRIWWGLIIGVGIALLWRHQWRPWQATLTATLASLVSGLLIARFVGIILDGSVARQWLYVGVEGVILMPLI